DEVGRVAARHNAPALGRHEIEPARPAVHVGAEDLDVVPAEERADDRDARRTAGTGHEGLGDAHALASPSRTERSLSARTAAAMSERVTETSAASRTISSGSQLIAPAP